MSGRSVNISKKGDPKPRAEEKMPEKNYLQIASYFTKEKTKAGLSQKIYFYCEKACLCIKKRTIQNASYLTKELFFKSSNREMERKIR